MGNQVPTGALSTQGFPCLTQSKGAWEEVWPPEPEALSLRDSVACGRTWALSKAPVEHRAWESTGPGAQPSRVLAKMAINGRHGSAAGEVARV